ncbi:hypothetical protein LCGC14_0692990 [marine sediment metagenome]|uniref:Uncharacterized protein n=1 Tax=marine sediment metagenome TaxID=412755 RepID=A0A0F9R594_9ZZZZ
MIDHQAEGEHIASQLGLVYNGPQMWGETFLFYTFTDPTTRTTFGARGLNQALANLLIKRQLFKMKPPDFPDIPDPAMVVQVFNKDVLRILDGITRPRGE